MSVVYWLVCPVFKKTKKQTFYVKRIKDINNIELMVLSFLHRKFSVSGFRSSLVKTTKLILHVDCRCVLKCQNMNTNITRG